MLATAISFGLLLLSVKAQDRCTPPSGKPSCVCETSDGVIDLTSMSYQDGNPYFPFVYDPGNQVYSYNPCHEFSDGSTFCSYGDVSVCQNAYGGEEHSCGTSSSETMHVDVNGQYYLQYDGGDGDRISQVFLVCDSTANEPELTADGDGETTLTYVFHLKTKCACPGTCVDAPPPTDPNPPHKGGGGGGGGIEGAIGIVLIILAIGGVATYFIVGAIILKFKFERTGTDIIPQKEFWFDLPFLIKDGCVFTFTPLYFKKVNEFVFKCGWGSLQNGYSLQSAVIISESTSTPPSGKPNCVCETNDGVIDLTSMSYQDGNPYYNPSFYDGYITCSYGDVAIFQNPNVDEEHNCGTSSSETLHVDDNRQYYLQYDGGDEDRISQVFLVCDETVDELQLTADGDSEMPLTYIFHLKTKCACPGVCAYAPPPTDPNPPHKGGGGGIEEGAIGIVLIILAIGGLVTYFIAGAVILKFKFEKTGADIIPQKTLWFALPFLIKDGCVFTFTPLVRLIRRDGNNKLNTNQHLHVTFQV